MLSDPSLQKAEGIFNGNVFLTPFETCYTVRSLRTARAALLDRICVIEYMGKQQKIVVEDDDGTLTVFAVSSGVKSRLGIICTNHCDACNRSRTITVTALNGERMDALNIFLNVALPKARYLSGSRNVEVHPDGSINLEPLGWNLVDLRDTIGVMSEKLDETIQTFENMEGVEDLPRDCSLYVALLSKALLLRKQFKGMDDRDVDKLLTGMNKMADAHAEYEWTACQMAEGDDCEEVYLEDDKED